MSGARRVPSGRSSKSIVIARAGQPAHIAYRQNNALHRLDNGVRRDVPESEVIMALFGDTALKCDFTL